MHESRAPLIAIAIATLVTFAPPSRAQAPVAAPLAAELATLNAVVEEIDQASRRLTLKAEDGSTVAMTVAPEVANFATLKKGERVVVRHIVPVAISATGQGGSPAGAASSVVMETAKPGEKSAKATVDTEEISATVEAIDPNTRTVVLRSSDGESRTVKVDPGVSLTDVAVGDRATLRITKVVAVAVDAPATP